AAAPPRLAEFSFGDETRPKVTLIGKGVCFDSGGLDIKPESAMRLMKKDMGGAAAALALASMIMEANLPVRLRVIVPIVENAVSGSAFRPGDIYKSRKGLTVEIGNTDAEGRLILADALALADEEAPELLIDFATLTGAARVALGPDVPPFYTMDEEFAADVARAGAAAQDPVWRMPLWEPYNKLLDSKIADVNNIASSPFAGSVTAALFLRRFVERAKSWAHFDIYAWTPQDAPGRPEGAEIQAARLLYDLIEARYQAKG
ncbi:MAG TPA: leucyl aminopeptidase family protein, partial [Methylocella sp.]|nr:leucyl aminopeptidase family protein [Methylocella sp.]